MRDVCESFLTVACEYTITLKKGVRNLEKANSITPDVHFFMLLNIFTP